MPDRLSFSPVVVITALTAFLGGGLAGSVFTWLVNRREPTVVTYSVSQTELADPTASALIPNLTVRVGKESIRELHAYTIDIDVPQGSRKDGAQVGIFFSHKVRIYGKSADAPSRLYSINCDQIDNGLKCQISPAARANNKGYRIVLATDEKESPLVEVSLQEARVVSALDYANRRSTFWNDLSPSKMLGLVGLLVLAIPVFLLQIRLLKRVYQRDGGSVVGKITDQEGQPVRDADVEIILESPKHTFPPTKTDRFGDFLLGGLHKFSLYKGRVRITHPNFVSLETQIDSPIVSLSLQRSTKREREGS